MSVDWVNVGGMSVREVIRSEGVMSDRVIHDTSTESRNAILGSVHPPISCVHLTPIIKRLNRHYQSLNPSSNHHQPFSKPSSEHRHTITSQLYLL